MADFLVKIVIVGDSFVGKSSFVERFVHDSCMEIRPPTMSFEFCTTYRRIFNKLSKIQIWDEAGQDRFRTSRSNAYYQAAHWIIIMYDITNAESFVRVTSKWLRELNNYYHNSSTKIIVGNKRDLELLRVVKREEGQKLADNIGAAFCEVSAKSGENCEECMIDILWQEMLKVKE